MEAIEIGMPVLATDVGSSRDMASLSKAVLLIDPPGGAVLELDGLKLKDAVKSDNRVFVTALAEGMRTMIVDGDGMEQLAKEAAGSVSRSYSIDAMVEGYIRHFTAAKAFLRNANHQIYPNVA